MTNQHDIADECEHRMDKTKTKDVLQFAVALDEWCAHLSQPEVKAAMPISNIPDLLALAADTITTQSARIATLEKLVREAMPVMSFAGRWLSAAREAVGEVSR